MKKRRRTTKGHIVQTAIKIDVTFNVANVLLALAVFVKMLSG